MIFIAVIFDTKAQQLTYSQDFYTTQQTAYFVNRSDTSVFLSVKPLIKAGLHSKNISDSRLNYPERDKKYLQKHKAN